MNRLQTKMKQQIKEMLLHPSGEARGYTRWWWFGCAVTHREIIRELDFMLEAGIGGVELQILYPVEPDDPEKDVKNNFYLSPGYLEAIRFAGEEAKKRGMKLDVTLGSSWPFGGPFIPVEYSAPNVIPYTIDVEGPCEFSYDFTTRFYGECVGCIMGKMEHSEMIPESIQDITDSVQNTYLFQWEWGKKLQTIRIPEGSYKIVVFISNDKRQTVLKPVPGGEGLIVDHNRMDAVRFFLRQAGDPIDKAVGSGLIQSYFCDSIEVFGQNWTDIIYEEFRKRRGYELRPYIYALWGNVRGMTDLIRYDFQKTLGELTVENFFQELTKWCHEKGCTSRIQAHGTWGDILKAYAAADIPEGETFSPFDKYEVNTVHRRLASSAGHIYGKKIISNESFTWLRFPRFLVTLEILKAAVDSILLDGMNQIVNHGYAYSPEEAGHPGWSFYASTQINHENTWWPHYRYIGRYINRVCEFLRKGRTKVPVAIYLPQADIWAENPLSDIHMCMKLEERLTTKTVDRIQKEGFWFDYVNDEALEDLEERGYEALLFLETDRISLESARNVMRFAQKGGKVICKEHPPVKSCGLLKYEERTGEVRRIFREMAEDGMCVVTEGGLEGLIEQLHSLVKRDVVIRNHKDTIGFVHQEDGDRDIYFLSNISSEWKSEELVFCGQLWEAAIFDPMTAREVPVKRVVHKNRNTVIELTFQPFQSMLFVFDKALVPDYCWEEEKQETELLDISRDWKMRVSERDFCKTYTVPESWEQEKELKYYSGSGVYEKAIILSKEQMGRIKGRKVYLVLEHLGESGTVFINGKEAGVILMRPYRLDISGYLQEGENQIRIKVYNLLINQALDPEKQPAEIADPVIGQWPYSTEKMNQCRRERLLNWRELEMIKEPLQSGIWGRVLLTVC